MKGRIITAHGGGAVMRCYCENALKYNPRKYTFEEIFRRKLAGGKENYT